MRLIDADEAKKLEQMYTLKPSERALFRLMLDRVPTYEPPNPPLTLDELREMDGDWVWIEHPDKDADCIGWAKVEVGLPGERRGLWLPHVYVVSENGQRDYAGLLLECGDKFYRHKPEKVTR